MKPEISKTPKVPALTANQINLLTEIVFGPPQASQPPCDLLFVFGGTHPGHWETALAAYQAFSPTTVLVTGGRSKTGVHHPLWATEEPSEAEVIAAFLRTHGIPNTQLYLETTSSNSLENVTHALALFPITTIKQLIFVCKSHAAGRQWRTLTKHLPSTITCLPYTFDAHYQGIAVGRNDWMTSTLGRERVWGEYLRILTYGERGDLTALKNSEQLPF